MSGRKQEFNRQFYQIIDGAILVAAFWAAHALRITTTGLPLLNNSVSDFDQSRWLLFLIMPFGPIFLEIQGYYTHPLQKTLSRSCKQMTRAAIWLTLLISASAFFFKLNVPGRAVFIFFGLLSALFLQVRERLSYWNAQNRAKSERYREPVLLAGTPGDVRALEQSFTPDQYAEMAIVGRVNIEREPICQLIDLLHQHSASRVIFTGGHTHMGPLQEAIAACEAEGVEAWVVADFIKTSIAQPSFDTLGTRPMLVFRTTPELSWALLIKGVFDRVSAFILLLATAPLMALTAIGIKLTSPGPIVFKQERAGKNGKPFIMFKFRSMATNAEMLHSELVNMNQMRGPVFKIDKDPRITTIGHWIRKTSIDELPQLLNVLRGEMSLVGPRPLPIYEVKNFENAAQRRRLSVKPGLTCLWQISGRNKITSFEEWVKLDLAYIDNWSLWLDFKIILRTIPAVLFGKGAR